MWDLAGAGVGGGEGEGGDARVAHGGVDLEASRRIWKLPEGEGGDARVAHGGVGGGVEDGEGEEDALLESPGDVRPGGEAGLGDELGAGDERVLLPLVGGMREEEGVEQRDVLGEVGLQPAAHQDADVDFAVEDSVDHPLKVALIEYHLDSRTRALTLS